MDEKPKEAKETKEINGARNLTILGVVTLAIAGGTTAFSVWLYHHSGDIYLDRSRPGFLPDEEETEHDLPDSAYKFGETGPLDEQTLDEYTKHFNEVLDYIDDLKTPFSETPLSNETLGIPDQNAEAAPPESGNI